MHRHVREGASCGHLALGKHQRRRPLQLRRCRPPQARARGRVVRRDRPGPHHAARHAASRCREVREQPDWRRRGQGGHRPAPGGTAGQAPRLGPGAGSGQRGCRALRRGRSKPAIAARRPAAAPPAARPVSGGQAPVLACRADSARERAPVVALHGRGHPPPQPQLALQQRRLAHALQQEGGRRGQLCDAPRLGQLLREGACRRTARPLPPAGALAVHALEGQGRPSRALLALGRGLPWRGLHLLARKHWQPQPPVCDVHRRRGRLAGGRGRLAACLAEAASAPRRARLAARQPPERRRVRRHPGLLGLLRPTPPLLQLALLPRLRGGLHQALRPHAAPPRAPAADLGLDGLELRVRLLQGLPLGLRQLLLKQLCRAAPRPHHVQQVPHAGLGRLRLLLVGSAAEQLGSIEPVVLRVAPGLAWVGRGIVALLPSLRSLQQSRCFGARGLVRFHSA
mmetsp:Transcript_11126/g.42929  ORF Transcript_11126/g.42929 Transcript_11126/m.42929 type:complete len:455 (-) Transcript_11126:220-1584(-)